MALTAVLGPLFPAAQAAMEEEDQAEVGKKRQRPAPEPARTTGKGKGKGKMRNNWARGGWQKQDTDMEEALKAMAKLCLRQETELAELRAEKGFILHLQTAAHGEIKPLTQASIKWHEQRDQALVNTSLKACLFSMLLKETAARIELFENNPSSMEAAVKASWVTLQQPGNEIKWLYQKWDPDAQEMVLDKDRPGCTHVQAKQIINTMDGALTKDPAALNQFKALRQLTTNMQGASVIFQVSVGLRGPTS